jgi:DNA-binding transcriptional ArsR family regulator
MQAAIDALAHPTRRAMLRLVLDRELPVGELARRTGLSQPAARLVRGRVDGRRRLYQVDLQGLQRLRAELDSLWEPALLALKQAAEAEGGP